MSTPSTDIVAIILAEAERERALSPSHSAKRAFEDIFEAVIKMRVKGDSWERITNIIAKAGFYQPNGNPYPTLFLRVYFSQMGGPSLVRQKLKAQRAAKLGAQESTPPEPRGQVATPPAMANGKTEKVEKVAATAKSVAPNVAKASPQVAVNPATIKIPLDQDPRVTFKDGTPYYNGHLIPEGFPPPPPPAEMVAPKLSKEWLTASRNEDDYARYCRKNWLPPDMRPVTPAT